MSYPSATRTKIGGALVLAAAVPLAVWIVMRSKAPEPPSEMERLHAVLARRSSHWSSHGDVTPRSLDDPRNARIRGCVSRAGKPVPRARVTAMVWPTGMRFTLDHAVAGHDGCYEIVITASHLRRKQSAKIYVDPPLVGRILVPVEPGGMTTQADLEVGAGFVIRGVVRDEQGAAVPHALVTDGRDRSEQDEVRTDETGRFAIRVSTAGRVQLHAPEYEETEPVVFDVPRLDGEVGGVVLTVGDELVRPPTSHERRVAGATTYTIKPVSLRPNANRYRPRTYG